MELDVIYNQDCLEGMAKLPDSSIDLVIIDPPYETSAGGNGGAFGVEQRSYHAEVKTLSEGISNNVLDELVRVMKK